MKDYTSNILNDYLSIDQFKSNYSYVEYDGEALIIRNFDKNKSLKQPIIINTFLELIKSSFLLISVFAISFFVYSLLYYLLTMIFNSRDYAKHVDVQIIILTCLLTLYYITIPCISKYFYFKSYVCGFFRDYNVVVFNKGVNLFFNNIRIYSKYYEYNLSDITKLICARTPNGNSISLMMESKKTIINLNYFINEENCLGKDISNFLNVEYEEVGINQVIQK
ncbi:hypothetical protein NIES2100_71770 [Calothrix sp. NIES-2100]|uniref:hypothetical protein n=1 Tax=Calothrix sp. NIES-2100 TaxID=1954172 RepID=UPI000B6010A6|nr:hypothetical protein NIES2100_71770 [Calothrix sp. NIES-2100]